MVFALEPIKILPRIARKDEHQLRHKKLSMIGHRLALRSIRGGYVISVMQEINVLSLLKHTGFWNANGAAVGINILTIPLPMVGRLHHMNYMCSWCLRKTPKPMSETFRPHNFFIA